VDPPAGTVAAVHASAATQVRAVVSCSPPLPTSSWFLWQMKLLRREALTKLRASRLVDVCPRPLHVARRPLAEAEVELERVRALRGRRRRR
jgi:hypothetical protein